ncbi:MAG: hypothetical protein U0359_11535 [Byssovorax sp.]
MRLFLDVFAQNEWANVERLRGAAERCLLAATGDAELGSAVSIIVAELGENAIKYGCWGGPTQTFRVKITAEGEGIRVEVECPWSADRSIADLLDTVARLRAHPTARDAYQARVREIEAGRDGGSRLGLLRLAYETGCCLSVEEEAELVRVIATIGGE